MPLVLTCDDVFERLTRGPFPEGCPQTADAVECHLGACHECRRLAEALRPAVELLHESLCDEADDLPRYEGEVKQRFLAQLAGGGPPVASPNHSASFALGTRESRRAVEEAWDWRRQWFRQPQTWWQLLALMIVTIPVISLMQASLRSSAKETGSANHQVPLQLAALQLPAECFQRAAAAAPAADWQLKLCCVGCHSPGTGHVRSPRGIERIMEGCAHCHVSH